MFSQSRKRRNRVLGFRVLIVGRGLEVKFTLSGRRSFLFVGYGKYINQVVYGESVRMFDHMKVFSRRKGAL
jgi:hypothetical protein